MSCFVRFVQIFPWEFLVDEVITEKLLSQMLFIVKHLICGRISSRNLQKDHPAQMLLLLDNVCTLISEIAAKITFAWICMTKQTYSCKCLNFLFKFCSCPQQPHKPALMSRLFVHLVVTKSHFGIVVSSILVFSCARLGGGHLQWPGWCSQARQHVFR